MNDEKYETAETRRVIVEKIKKKWEEKEKEKFKEKPKKK